MKYYLLVLNSLLIFREMLDNKKINNTTSVRLKNFAFLILICSCMERAPIFSLIFF